MNKTPCPLDIIIIGDFCVNWIFCNDRFLWLSDDIIYDYKNRKSNCEDEVIYTMIITSIAVTWSCRGIPLPPDVLENCENSRRHLILILEFEPLSLAFGLENDTDCLKQGCMGVAVTRERQGFNEEGTNAHIFSILSQYYFYHIIFRGCGCKRSNNEENPI